jgi:DNA-binding GntR family transcriptional regulator
MVFSMPTEKIGNTPLQTNLLAEQVYRILMHAILEGVLKGGDKLVEAELQKKFNTSRSPLREAFRELEKRGLVVIVPRKGTYVKRISRKDIEDHFPVRSILEGLAAKASYGKMSSGEKRKMAQALQKMEAAVAANNTTAYWNQHLTFHEIFINACENVVLTETLSNLRMHSMWYRFSYQYYQEDLNKSLAIHQEIHSAFGDPETHPDSLGTLVQFHIEEAYERFLAYLETQEPGNGS